MGQRDRERVCEYVHVKIGAAGDSLVALFDTVSEREGKAKGGGERIGEGYCQEEGGKERRRGREGGRKGRRVREFGKIHRFPHPPEYVDPGIVAGGGEVAVVGRVL